MDELNDLDIAVMSLEELEAEIGSYNEDWKGWLGMVERVLAVQPAMGPQLVESWKNWRVPNDPAEFLARLKAVGFRWRPRYINERVDYGGLKYKITGWRKP